MVWIRTHQMLRIYGAHILIWPYRMHVQAKQTKCPHAAIRGLHTVGNNTKGIPWVSSYQPPTNHWLEYNRLSLHCVCIEPSNMILIRTARAFHCFMNLLNRLRLVWLAIVYEIIDTKYTHDISLHCTSFVTEIRYTITHALIAQWLSFQGWFY